MTNQEAIELLKEVEIIDDSMFQYIPKYMEALKMAIAALERQEPVKPNDVKCDHIITGYCGMCGNYVNGTDNYCSDCGQRLDWTEDTK